MPILADVMTASERLARSLERDFKSDPLSPEEREEAGNHLRASLLELGCPEERLEALCLTIAKEISTPRRLLYVEALDRVVAAERQRVGRPGAATESGR